MTLTTATGIAYDRIGPRTAATVVLLHAGVADRRMWDPQWERLAASYDVVRLDLRGFGDSVDQRNEAWSAYDDVISTVTSLGVDRAHLVGCSLGAGVAVEVALARPELVASLMLASPAGCLIAERTPELERFITHESTAVARGDLDAAADANVRWWVDGPRRAPGTVDENVRDAVRRMQRRAFEVTGAVLLSQRIPLVTLVRWPDVAHLPSLERPADFADLLDGWLRSV